MRHFKEHFFNKNNYNLEINKNAIKSFLMQLIYN